jgi:hypothetical protein
MQTKSCLDGEFALIFADDLVTANKRLRCVPPYVPYGLAKFDLTAKSVA